MNSDETQGPVLVCPECGAENPVGGVSCAQCHESLFGIEPSSAAGSEAAPAPTRRNCPECGSEIGASTEVCPHCSALVPPEPTGPTAARATAPGTPVLTLRCESLGQSVAVAPGDVIGREAMQSRLLADSLSISRRHCRVDFRADTGSWELMDLGSSNGSFVNDRTLQPGVPESIAPGDRIELGDVVFHVEGDTRP